jgi:tetratricopeptide (TPR) repeat protein
MLPTEFTREQVKDLYGLATNTQASRNYVYAIRLFEIVAETGEPFYTPFAVAAISQCYATLGRRDLEVATFKRVTQLPKEQQRLLNPGWLALSYQRAGDLKEAINIHAEILELAPHEPNSISAVAELSLLQGNLHQAQAFAERLRQRAEPPYQILGRLIFAFAFALQNRNDEALKELLWVGESLISTGNIQAGFWDYRDVQPLVAKMGPNTNRAELLLGALSGTISFPEFMQRWNETTIPLPSSVSRPGLGAPLESPSQGGLPDIKKKNTG